jgi:hypothetical protein
MTDFIVLKPSKFSLPFFSGKQGQVFQSFRQYFVEPD